MVAMFYNVLTEAESYVLMFKRRDGQIRLFGVVLVS